MAASSSSDPATCLHCRKWHSRCNPSLEVNEDGSRRKSTCERCKNKGIECVYPTKAVRKGRPGPRMGRRIKEAQRLFGDRESAEERGKPVSTAAFENSHARRTFGQSSKPGPVAVSQQDLHESSLENNMRRHERQGSLVFDLIQSVLRGVRVGMLPNWPGNRTQGLAMSSFMAAFERNGLHLQGEILGPMGEANLALICAVGGSLSSHSQMVGGTILSSAERQFPQGWFKDELADRGSKAKTPLTFGEEADMRIYGLGRQPILRRLWRFCWDAFEKSGLLDENRAFSFEELQLIHHFYGFVASVDDLFSQELKTLRKLLLNKIGQQWDQNLEVEQSAMFQVYLSGESTHNLYNAELPTISDELLTRFMDTADVPARLFLSFDTASIPSSRNADTYNDIVWASYLSVERMLAVTAHSLPNLPHSEADRVLIRMFSIIEDRTSWRKSITRREISPQGGHTIIMTPYGVENDYLTKLDAWSTMACYGLLLRLISERIISMCPNPTSCLKNVYECCAKRVDENITGISMAMDDDPITGKPQPLWCKRRALVSLDLLPGSLGYLREYLQRSTNPQDLLTRTRHVSRFWKFCRHLCFTGQKPLRNLQDLEKSMNMSYEEFQKRLSKFEKRPNNNTLEKSSKSSYLSVSPPMGNGSKSPSLILAKSDPSSSNQHQNDFKDVVNFILWGALQDVVYAYGTPSGTSSLS